MKWARKIKEENWQMLSVESEEKEEVQCTPITVSLNFVDGIIGDVADDSSSNGSSAAPT